jgi:hypothetical protein
MYHYCIYVDVRQRRFGGFGQMECARVDCYNDDDCYLQVASCWMPADAYLCSCYDNFFETLAVFSQIFAAFFGKNILKFITLTPWLNRLISSVVIYVPTAHFQNLQILHMYLCLSQLVLWIKRFYFYPNDRTLEPILRRPHLQVG